MSRHGGWWWGGLVALVAAVPATAGGFRPAGAPVPPTQEIEVLDPGVDPTGVPAILLRPNPAGGQRVEVPPAVLVHRYYYTGDRSFQGPMLPGGPTIVSVNHPATLERVYVPVTMPPGAPRVTYTAKAIRYDYGPQSVTLSFGVCGKPTVRYSQGTVAGEAARGAASQAFANTRDLVRRTGFPEGVARFTDDTRKLLATGADAVGSLGRAVTEPVRNGFSSLTATPNPTPEAFGSRRPSYLPTIPSRLPPPASQAVDDVFVQRRP